MIRCVIDLDKNNIRSKIFYLISVLLDGVHR